MGLISWIKSKYYDYRLKKADKRVIEGKRAEADSIYRDLLGKHSMAVVNLAKMLVDRSDSVNSNLSALKSIIDLKGWTDTDNFELYNNELKSQIANIEKVSTQKFNSKQYHDASLLIDAITPHRKDDKAFMKRCHQIHAYLSFSKITQASDYNSEIADTVKYLKLYEDSCKRDINVFIDSLKSSSYFSRAIKLLLPLLSLDKKYNDTVNDLIVLIVNGGDRDYDEPNNISDFCSDKSVCVKAANHLFELSNQAAKKNDYSQSVLYDSFASEFLSSDNNFNVTRCNHIFKKIEKRPSALEIKDLLELAKKIKLSEKQIDALKKDIATLAKNVEPQKGIEICRLFLSERDFDLIYIDQAKNLAAAKPSSINTKELMTVIKQNTDEDSFVDVLSPFVNLIPEFDDTFVKNAIDKIVRHKSMAFLDKYWTVKEDTAFFDRLISPASGLSKQTVEHVVNKHELFLNSESLLASFLKSLDTLKDNDYAYLTAEKLQLNGLSVIPYYLDKANKKCEGLPDSECVELIDHTLSVIDYLHIYQSSWIPLFLKKRKIKENGITSLSQKTSFYRESIDTIVNSDIDFRDVSEPSYFSLWQEYSDLVLKKSESQPKEKAIKDLTEVRGLVANYCKSYSTYSSLCESFTTRIAKLRWESAKEYEEDCDFEKAINQYEATIREGASDYKVKANYRRLICLIKDNQITDNLEEEIKAVLNDVSNQIQNIDDIDSMHACWLLNDELAYRYACYLIKAIRPGDAEYVLDKCLPKESHLSEICKNLYIKESEKYLKEFNANMSAIADNSLPLKDAKTFLNRFAEYKKVISRNLTDTTNKFVLYRRRLETYIVKSLFDEEKYAEAFSMLIRNYPNFFEDDTNFRNVAIAALGIIEDGDESVDEGTFKYAISIWLSAVFSDRLFVKSLDYTSWDDQYTFTLQNSLGGTNEDDYEDLPENVNFDDPIDNQNVSIADVQNSLVSRVETIIRDKRSQLESFFNSEKDALDQLIALDLDEDFITASPYFALKHERLLESIKDAMDYECSCEYGNEEKVLSLGVKYGFDTNEYADYKEALECAERCKNALAGTKTQLKAEMASIPVIKEYESLFASLKAYFSSRMNDDIKAKMNYKKFIDIYEIICNAFHDNSLSLAFSQYANGEVVRRLNNDSMELNEGIGYMVRIYNIAPSSIQVKENLEGMLCNLASSCAETPNAANEQVLSKALRDTGSAFRAEVENARIQGTLSAIIDKVNNKRMTEAKALDEVYELYKKTPNNDRICENLVTLCDMCIMEYIIGRERGYTNVRKTLTALNNNKSATFNRHSRKLAQQYVSIWNKLPSDTRMAISGLSFTSTLTSKGEALKEGLDFYKKLGNYTPSGGRSSFLDLIGGGL